MSSPSTLKKDIFGLATASAIDYVLQFLVPMAVARALSPDEFGGYRMAWLVASTILAFAPLHVPHSLSYFLPRVEKERKVAYIVSAFALLTGTALLSALAVNPWLPLLPLHWLSIGQPGWFFPVFVALWVMGSLSDWVAVSDGRAQWQAKAIILLSISRTALIAMTAALTGSLQSVLLAMLVFALLKFSVTLAYVARFHLRRWSLHRSVVIEQFRYAWPFGVGDGFYLLRQQGEQWLVASMFSAREFASFSLGGVAAPLFTLMRQSVQNAVLPKLNALHAQKDMAQLAALNRKATSAVAFFLLPVACMLWAYAEDVITVIYTSAYREAGAVMQIYLIGFMPQIFESTILLRVAGYGSFGLGINLFMLPVALGVSYLGIHWFGLPGGAMGSVLCSALTQMLSVRKVCRGQRVPYTALYDMRVLGLYLVLGIGCSALSRVVVAPFFDKALTKLVFGGASAACLFVLLAYLLKIMPSVIGEKLGRILHKFSSR